jgi:hypothetical protein
VRILLWVALIAGLLLVVYGFVVGNKALGISPSVAIGGALAFLSNYYLQLVTARSQRETEEIRQDAQAQDAAIAAYTEKMSGLIIEHNVDGRPDNRYVLRVAEALTISTLVQLDSERKRIVLKVAYTLGLIRKNNPLLYLHSATLDHADLNEFRLRDANLSWTDLRGSDLSGSDLSYADLRGANLTNADLSYVNLSGANLLPYDEANPSALSFHNLRDFALPSDDYLHSLAKQQEAAQQRTLRRRFARRFAWWVRSTNLTDTKLAGANLTGAILANADL